MDSSAHTHITTFHRFPHLPPELRHAIWTLAPEPRIIHLREGPKRDLASDNQSSATDTDSDNPEDLDDEPEWLHQVGAVPEHLMPSYMVSSGPCPSIMYTCAESRSVAITRRLYEAAFAYPWSPRYTWINFDLDTIQLEQGILRILPPVDRSRIRNAILDATYDAGAWHFSEFIVEERCHMGDMKALRDLRLLSEEPPEEWDPGFQAFRLQFKEWFSADEGWAPPTMIVMNRATGEIMDEEHCWRSVQPPSRGGYRGTSRAWSRGGGRGGGRGHSGP